MRPNIHRRMDKRALTQETAAQGSGVRSRLMKEQAMKIYPVILSGGSGRRCGRCRARCCRSSCCRWCLTDHVAETALRGRTGPA